MTDVAPLVREHVARLFPMEQQEQVTRLLREDCGAALPCTDNASEEFFERVQCAALKLSEGRVGKIYDAITLAQTNWRDRLVSAGFAEDTQAHKDWNKQSRTIPRPIAPD